MNDGELALAPDSRLPGNAHERDLLLRRMPELTLAPEILPLRFARHRVLSGAEANHAGRIAELADTGFLERLRGALLDAGKRAEAERNGGLVFLVTSLQHFLSTLPAERHPLVVALYFASGLEPASAKDDLEEVARRMDEYEGGLEPLVAEAPTPPSRPR